MKRAVLVFLKFPEPGKVKTRLASTLGEEAACMAYRQMVAKVFEQCRDSAADLIAIAYDPPEKRSDVIEWLSPYLEAFPGETVFLPQVDGDLGQRLEAGVEEVYRSHPGISLAVVGTDCVELDHEIFKETWSSLEGKTDVTYGPTEDGGYYLVAMKEPQVCLFREIPWSSEITLEASLSAASVAGLEVHLLSSRLDVDTEREWKQVEAGLHERRCLFFDRDGVVNRSPGPGYVLKHEDFHLNPGIPEALTWARNHGWLSILVTSQRGVGKGLMSSKDLEQIHRKMQLSLRDSGGEFDGIYAYTELPDCPFPPKPEPGMVLAAAESFFIDRRQSWMIGDADRDIEMGNSAGLAGTIRIRGDKPIGIEADHTLDDTRYLVQLLEKFE